MRFLLFVVGELGDSCCGVGGDGGVVAAGGAVLLYYDCTVFVGVVRDRFDRGDRFDRWDRYDRGDRFDRFWQPRMVAFLVFVRSLSVLCEYCSHIFVIVCIFAVGKLPEVRVTNGDMYLSINNKNAKQ